MTLRQPLPGKAKRLPFRLLLGLMLLLGTCCWSFSTAQGLTEDPDLRRLRDGASRLRELPGWDGRAASSGQKRTMETPAPTSTTPQPAVPAPPAQPVQPKAPPRPPTPVAAAPAPLPPAVPLATAEELQTLKWHQDALAVRIDEDLGDLRRRLLASEERIAQLSAILSWFSGAIVILLAMVGAMLLRVRRRGDHGSAAQEEEATPPAHYLPLPPLPVADRLATCEMLLLSGHYQQCLQQSRDAAAEATLPELPLLYFFEAAARRLLGVEDTFCEERLRASVQMTPPCDWPLNEIDSWLLLADMPEQDRTYLETLVECLRSGSRACLAAKESPSRPGGALSG